MPSQCLHILLAGKTGTGKSATGNSIVGHHAFSSKTSFESITKTAQFEFGEFDGKKLKVVDGPGMCDTNVSIQEGAKLVIDATTAAVTANPNGYHAILLIIKYGERLTNEDVKAVEMLKAIFGQDFIRYHAILLMTYGDRFREEEGDINIEDWCSKQKGNIKKLIDECNGRVILFDNKTNDKNIKTEQMKKLLKMIETLSGNGALYTSSIFDTAKQTRDDFLKEYQNPQLSEEALLECSLIRQQTQLIDYNNPEEAMVILKSLQSRAKSLEEDVMKQTRDKYSFRAAVELVQQMRKRVNKDTKEINAVLQQKQQNEQKKEKLAMSHSDLGASKTEVHPRRQENAMKETPQSNKVQEKQRRESVKDKEGKNKEQHDKVNVDLEKKPHSKGEREAAIILEENNKRILEKYQRELEMQRLQTEAMLQARDAELENIRRSYEEAKREQQSTWKDLGKTLAETVTGILTGLFG